MSNRKWRVCKQDSSGQYARVCFSTFICAYQVNLNFNSYLTQFFVVYKHVYTKSALVIWDLKVYK